MRQPTKFVGLHGHTGFSAFDGLGYPDEHFDFCITNGLQGHAITEHGHMNSYAHAQLYIEKYNKEHKDNKFKYIPGVEAYFHPDLKQWSEDKVLYEQLAAEKKAAAKLLKKQEKQTKIITTLDNNEDIVSIKSVDIDSQDSANQLVIENEDESKNIKSFNPINRRHHLVLLPKNQEGLLQIFSAISYSYLKGFYRFPRMDLEVLKNIGSKGNIIASSACLAGFLSWSIFNELQNFKVDVLDQSIFDNPITLDKCVAKVGNSFEMIADAIGKENFYLELQFNRLPAQNLVNRAIIEFAKRNGLTKQLIVTCDSHYHKPNLWKEREIYKRLGYLNFSTYNPDSLPKSKDDLKCELYPKNHIQVWEEYLRSKEGTNFYNDDLIIDAIERTHDIAFNVLQDIEPDRTPKFPNKKLVPEGTSSFQHLVKLCLDGMRKRKLDEKQEYIDRLKEELGVIKTLNNADYFVSYQKIMSLAKDVCLCGPGRGSGGGSLVAYVLYITDLDPIKWNLPFARFLSVYRKGSPDIDCLDSMHLINTINGPVKLFDIKVGDKIYSHDNSIRTVLFVKHRQQRNDELCYELLVNKNGVYGTIIASEDHRLLDNNANEIFVKDINIGDCLYKQTSIIEKNIINVKSLTDIEVEETRTFQVIPFNVLQINNQFIHTSSYL